MKNKIYNFIVHKLRTQNRKQIAENIASLFSLQMVNYVLPLITLPYLVRVLGVTNYGLVVFAQVFVKYFIILTNYGFAFTATRDISINKDNIKKVSSIFSCVFYTQLIIAIICFFFLCCTIFIFEKFHNNWIIYIFSFGAVLDSVLFPVWFFQGMEKMKYITIRNVIAKTFFTIIIFLFIKNENDFIFVPLIDSIGFIFTGIFGLHSVFKEFNVRLNLPNIKDIIKLLKEGFAAFFSLLSISLYTTTNSFILGIYLGSEAVGYYSAGEKIIRIIITLFAPITQALYPYISRLVTFDKEKALVILKKLLLIIALFMSIATICTYFSAELIVQIIFGKKFLNSIIIVKIFSPLLLIIPISSVLANLFLMPLRLDKDFLRIYVTGGILNIGFLFLFLKLMQMGFQGAAWCNLIVEALIMIMLGHVLIKNKILCPLNRLVNKYI